LIHPLTLDVNSVHLLQGLNCSQRRSLTVVWQLQSMLGVQRRCLWSPNQLTPNHRDASSRFTANNICWSGSFFLRLKTRLFQQSYPGVIIWTSLWIVSQSAINFVYLRYQGNSDWWL